ncbi:MAG: DNA mismatch repair protein MutL, partial [Chitinophagaceae bacterium]
VDVNVHPTKQEIKFEDEKIVYAFVQAAVKHALAQFSITPTLDFGLDASIQSLEAVQRPFTESQQSAARGSQLYQGFTQANQAHAIEASRAFQAPSRGAGALPDMPRFESESAALNPELSPDAPDSNFTPLLDVFRSREPWTVQQLFGTYILAAEEDRFLLIHQQSAHERILYERAVVAMQGKPIATQRSLFPSSIELSAADAVLLTELLPDLEQVGYHIEPFGKSAFAIQGTPADVEAGNEKVILERILEQVKHFSEVKLPRREMLLRSVALQQSIKPGTSLGEKEMQRLVDDLFKCRVPNATPSGKPTYVEFGKEGLDKMFGR